jgi:ribosomal protein L28
MHATKRKFKVNIIKKYIDFGDGQKVKVKLAANVYKSLVRKGVI